MNKEQIDEAVQHIVGKKVEWKLHSVIFSKHTPPSKDFIMYVDYAEPGFKVDYIEMDTIKAVLREKLIDKILEPQKK